MVSCRLLSKFEGAYAAREVGGVPRASLGRQARLATEGGRSVRLRDRVGRHRGIGHPAIEVDTAANGR